jgi:hypothetical protein
MEPLKNETLIRSLLTELFPLECKMVGESNLNNIVLGYTKEVQVIGGDSFGFSEAIAALTTAKEYISLLVDYFKGKKEKKEEPSRDKFVSDLPNIYIESIKVDIQINIYNRVDKAINNVADGESKE